MNQLLMLDNERYHLKPQHLELEEKDLEIARRVGLCQRVARLMRSQQVSLVEDLLVQQVLKLSNHITI
jgi:hypothetical protein